MESLTKADQDLNQIIRGVSELTDYDTVALPILITVRSGANIEEMNGVITQIGAIAAGIVTLRQLKALNDSPDVTKITASR